MHHSRKFILSIIYICFMICLGCVQKEIPSNKVDMPFMADKYFKKHTYSYKTIFSNHANEISNIYISKQNMTKFDYSIVEKSILDDGWVLKNNDNGLMTYCHGVNNVLGILYPINGEIYRSKSGSSIEISTYDNWLIYYHYDIYGVQDCES